MCNKQLIHEYRRMKLASKSLIKQPRSGVEDQGEVAGEVLEKAQYVKKKGSELSRMLMKC